MGATVADEEDNTHTAKARTKGAASGAMQGASIGSAAGPYGALIGGVLGGAAGALSPGTMDQLGGAGGGLVDAAKRKKKAGEYRGSFDANPELTPDSPDFRPEVF